MPAAETLTGVESRSVREFSSDSAQFAVSKIWLFERLPAAGARLRWPRGCRPGNEDKRAQGRHPRRHNGDAAIRARSGPAIIGCRVFDKQHGKTGRTIESQPPNFRQVSPRRLSRRFQQCRKGHASHRRKWRRVHGGRWCGHSQRRRHHPAGLGMTGQFVQPAGHEKATAGSIGTPRDPFFRRQGAETDKPRRPVTFFLHVSRGCHAELSDAARTIDRCLAVGISGPKWLGTDTAFPHRAARWRVVRSHTYHYFSVKAPQSIELFRIP
jgi:hypothetical protein